MTKTARSWVSGMKEGKPVTIVTYGDSWTYGSVAEGWYEARAQGGSVEMIQGSWAMQLKRYLQEINPQAILHNRGKGGWTSVQGADAYDRLVGAEKPDLLVLNFGINDWKKPIPLEEYRSCMEQMLDNASASGCDCVLWTSGPLSTASGESYGWASPMVDESFPHRFEEFNNTIRTLALERGLTLADAERVIAAEWLAGTDLSGWFYDAIHFTQNGHDLIFGCIRDTLERMMSGTLQA